MNRDELDAAHTAAIRRHWRTLVDAGGVPGPALLDDLAAIAGQYADWITAEGRPARPDGTPVPEPPSAAERRDARVRGEQPDPESAARAPARRTTTTARRRRPS